MNWEVNEHDEFTLTVSFRTSAGALTVPSSISYRIDAFDGTEILDDTSVVAASSVTLTLGYDANAITDQDAESEDHIVSVTAVFGTDSGGDPRQITRQFRYRVKNLAVFSA